MYARRREDKDRSREITQEFSSNQQRANACCGIIYVPSRSYCDELATRLRKADIGAQAYHAGLSTAVRAEVQNNWIANAPGYDIIVATTAFGMGIDKPDVRFVVHWSLPKSCEGYYQEAGRAGRDGLLAYCVLWYSREDRDQITYRIAKDATNANANTKDPQAVKNKEIQQKKRIESFKALVKYCEQKDRCRHKVISDFFADDGIEPCDVSCDQLCDFCDQGREEIVKRWREGLADEEWLNTQRERNDFYVDEYD